MPRSLLLASATELAARIQAREVTSRDVVDAHIAHIERVNPYLNAVVATSFAKARAEADEADRLITRRARAEGADDGAPVELPPLLGVPCTIKECFGVEGMPQSAGLWARRNTVAEAEATAVKRVRQAGAIVLGVTNTSELCMWMESDNRVYGRTRNPYDLRRTVGGSSGGEGAIVGAGAVPFGIGSDIGGSIRMPAFFNGVFGHKPSAGLVPSTGQHPLAENDALRYLGTGPLARRAEDLYPLLCTIAGPDGEDPACEAMGLLDPSEVDLTRLRVIDVPDDGGRLPVSRELHEAQRRVAEHLAALGCRVERRRIPALKRGLEAWSAMMNEAAETSFLDLLGDGAAVEVGPELWRFVLRRSPHTLPAIGLALLEGLTHRLEKMHQRALEHGRAMRAAVEDALGDDGIMLYPSHAVPAPYHAAALVPPLYWVYTGALNVLEMAVTQVPLGLNGRGVPLGVQVGALRGGDHLTLAAALELERAFGGWVPPGLGRPGAALSARPRP